MLSEEVLYLSQQQPKKASTQKTLPSQVTNLTGKLAWVVILLIVNVLVGCLANTMEDDTAYSACITAPPIFPCTPTVCLPLRLTAQNLNEN